jgi:hypothetical protein
MASWAQGPTYFTGRSAAIGAEGVQRGPSCESGHSLYRTRSAC